MRPFAGVVDRPGEIGQPRKVRLVRRRQAAHGHNAKLCRYLVALISFNRPALCALVIGGIRYPRVEADVPAQVKTVSHMIGVGQNFRLRRVFFRPFPFLLQVVGKRIRILQAFDIAARAGITVPVPGAANPATAFIHPCRKAEFAQRVQHIHARESRADNDGVKRGGFGRAFGGGDGHVRISPMGVAWAKESAVRAAQASTVGPCRLKGCLQRVNETDGLR